MNFNNHGLIVPDISFYQDDNSTPGKVDFAKMKAAGAMGVILRGGQNAWVDEDFQDYKRDAKAMGMLRGYYWFYDSRKDPGHQANLWRAAIGDDLPEMGLWYDFEDSYNGAYKAESYRKQFALAMDAFFPNSRRGVYTARWWWDSQALLDVLFWSRYPLWVAQYNVSQADVILPRPWVGKEPLFWQFTSHGDGAKYGVESQNIDLNYFNGDAARFQQLFGGTTPPPPLPTEGNNMIGRVLVNLNIRPTASTDYPYIGQLAPNDIVEGTVTAGWWKLTKWTRGGVAMTLPRLECYAYEGVTKGYIQTIEAPPPPPVEEYILHFKDGVTRRFVISNE